jgi:hypothetical protein
MTHDRPWLAEIAIDVEEAARVVARRFPEFAGRPLKALGEGWDNLAVLVDGTWVFRLPRCAPWPAADAPPLPRPQVLVDAFACRADQLAELVLREAQRDAHAAAYGFAVALGELEEALGQPRGHVEGTLMEPLRLDPPKPIPDPMPKPEPPHPPEPPDPR